ncbi:hypothetical protein N8580_00490 [Akkermansiaceae bacterium]|nr:hypothetical protein [Akkermansiaceae bacterium]
MKEKREMNVEFENTMEAIVKTMDLASLSAGSDNPQVFEVKFKLPGTGYSARSDYYRLVFDPNHLGDGETTDDALFLYQGDGILDKLMGMVDIQKNGKAIIVRDFWFGQKMTKTFRAGDMMFERITHYDANVPENYFKKVEEVETENLPF